MPVSEMLRQNCLALLAGCCILVAEPLFAQQPRAQQPSAQSQKPVAQKSPEKAPAARDPRIGTKVLITQAGAELKTPDATVWRAYLGEVFTVTLTNGEWLWIDEKGGWLWDKQTIPYSTAVNEVSKRIQKTPTAENFHLRGVALLAHREYDRAIADFSESLKREPKNAGALNNRGQCHYLKQNYSEAIRDFSAALKLDPKNFLARNNRSLAYIAAKDYKNAMADLQVALQQVPEYPEALNNRGVVNQKLGKLDESIRDFTAALKIDPKYTDALGNRAHTYRLKGDFSKAVADLEKAIALRPNTYEAINDLAWLLSTAKEDQFRNRERALKLAQQACEISEYKQWNTLDTLAAAYAENGNFDEAATWVSKSLELAPASEKPRIETHQKLIAAKQPFRE
ncbi:MAG: tetratricopeptide repeat protein [Planctomyces sp.]